MKLKLYIDCKNKKLVTSKTSDSEVTLNTFFREDTLPLQIFPLSSTGILTAPLEEIDVTNISLKVGIGETDGTLDSYQDTWVKDTSDNSMSGELSLNTQQINDALAQTSAESIERYLEIEITEDGNILTAAQIKCVISKDVIRNNQIAPTQIEPPTELTNSMNGILSDSETIKKETSGNTITHHIKGLENTPLVGDKIIKVATDPANGFVLADESGSASNIAINDLTDVDTNGVQDGSVIKYSDASSSWVIGSDIDTDTGATQITELSDVDTSSSNAPSDGQALVWSDSSSSWIPSTISGGGGGGASSLSELSDVGDVSGATSGKIIKHDGTSFVLADDDAGSNVLTHHNHTTTNGTVTADFDAGGIQSIMEVDGNLALTASNMDTGKTMAVRMESDDTAGGHVLAFPIGWRWLSPRPTRILDGETIVISLTAFGDTHNDILCAATPCAFSEQVTVVNGADKTTST